MVAGEYQEERLIERDVTGRACGIKGEKERRRFVSYQRKQTWLSQWFVFLCIE
jgi:hypothetical protein